MSNKYSPHDLLPTKLEPKDEEFKDEPDFFYNNVIQYLIPDILRMTNNGIPIDLDKVEKLEETVTKVLNDVDNKLDKSELLFKYQKKKYKKLLNNKKEEFENKKKTKEDFLKPFKLSNKIHRKYVINEFLIAMGKKEKYQLEEWLIKDVKQLNQIEPSPFLQKLINKELDENNLLVQQAMEQLAIDKCELYNAKYDDKFDSLTEEDVLPKFNPGSAEQKKDFLYSFLGIESETISKTTGDVTYPREELERILEEVNHLINEEE